MSLASIVAPFRTVESRQELKLLFLAQPVVPVVLLGVRLFGPIRNVPGLGWVVTDPLLARQIFNDAKHFSIVDHGGAGFWWKQVLGEWVLDLFDGVGHHRIRTAVRDLFTAEFTDLLVERAGGSSFAALSEDLAAGRQVDIVAWSRATIGRVLADLVGMTASDIADTFPDVDPSDISGLYRLLSTEGENLANYAMGIGAPDLTDEDMQSSKQVVERITSMVPRAYATAGDDTVLGRLRRSGVSEQHAIGLTALMVVAGTQTTIATVGRMVALLHDSGEQHTLLANPNNIDNTVREALRVTSAAAAVGRGVSHDVRIGGKDLKRGDEVKVFLWSINNAIGPFQADRAYVPELRQLWFSGGRHLCIGSTLVNIELARVLGALTASGKPWRIVERKARSRLLVPGYEKLIIELV